MKLIVRREALLEACRLAGRLLPERPVGPAGSHLLLCAGAADCELHADGREAALSRRLPAQVETPGRALLPAREAFTILRRSTAEEVRLEAAGGGLVLRAPGARFELDSPGPALLSPPEPFPAGPRYLLDAGDLRRAVRSTLFAAGPGSRRYRLEAVLCELEPGGLRLVATDNRRLAAAEVPSRRPCPPPGPAERLLPAGAVALLARLAEEETGPVEASFTPARAFFRADCWVLSAGYPEGAYPRWRSAVPDDPPHRLEVPAAGLLNAVLQAAVLGGEGGARLVLRLEPGRLVLESGRAGAGRCRVARRVPFAGGPVQVAVDPRLLVELLRCLEGEGAVQLGLTDADTPALFRVGGGTHVLVPLS